jgi:hypothetical protein
MNSNREQSLLKGQGKTAEQYRKNQIRPVLQDKITNGEKLEIR